MKVLSAREEVGRRDALIGDDAAVCPAPERLDKRLNATGLVGSNGHLNRRHVLLEDIVHIVVLVINLTLNARPVVACILLGHNLTEEVLAGLETFLVMVANNVGGLNLANVAALTGQHIVALVALGQFWHLVLGQAGEEFGCLGQGIDHEALGSPGMDTGAINSQHDPGRVEGLVFQLAHLAAIQRIGKVCREVLGLEAVGALADFFVGTKGQPNIAVRQIGMG